MSRLRRSFDVPGLLRRRRWTFVTAVLVGMGAAGAVSLFLPKTWEATARIEVSPHKAMADGELAEKVELVREQLLAAAAGGDGATRVDRDVPSGGVCRLHVGSAAATPDAAYGALVRLVRGCEDDIYAEPRERAGKDVEARRAALAAAEAASAEADTCLAAHEEANREVLRPLDDDLAAVQKEIQALEETVAGWKQKVQQATELLTAEQAFAKTQVRRVDPVRAGNVDAEIETATKRLADLTEKQRLGDDHADVIKTRTTLAELRKQRRELDENAPTEEVLQPNPIHAEYTKVRDEARSELTVAEARAAGLRRNEKRLSSLRLQAPPVRAAHEKLAAAAAEAKEVLENHRKQLAAAEHALATIDERRQLELKVVEAPRAPDAPVGPGAPLYALAGLAAGALAGLGIVVGIGATDRSFRESGAVAGALGVPALGEIALIETETDVAARRRAGMRRVALVALLGLASLGVVGAAVADGIAPAASDAAGGR